jgi:IS30 family transposase
MLSDFIGSISLKELIYHYNSQQKLSSVARKLNERTRKTLEYETPAEKFNQCVAPID